MIIGVDPHKRSHTAAAVANLAAQRVRVANKLHVVLRELVPGGADLAITAKSASTMLRSVRPASPCERTRKELAHDLVRDLRSVDASLADIEARMSDAPDDRGTRLRQVDDVGAVTAVRLIGRTGPASRFPTADALATYAGVAPLSDSLAAANCVVVDQRAEFGPGPNRRSTGATLRHANLRLDSLDAKLGLCSALHGGGCVDVSDWSGCG